MNSHKKYVVFDAYGTLFKVNGNLKNLTEQQSILSEKVQALWRSRQLEYTWLCNSMGVWMDFNQITYNALDYALQYYGVENDESFRSALLGIYKTPTTFSDVIPFLENLKAQGIATAILSNGTIAQIEASVKTAQIEKNLVDDIFSVSAVELFKPSPKVYQMVIDHYQCKAEEVAFFSSNAWDICGASRFGFYTTWVNRKNEPFEVLGIEPDLVVNAFSR